MTVVSIDPVAEARGASGWAVPLALALALLVAEGYNHTLFHTLAELFAVMVAMLLALVGWQTYPFSRNGFLMVLASGYFWIGALDLAHALTYPGVGVAPVSSADPSIQLWVGTRYLEALLLLTAPLALTRTPARRVVITGFGALAALLAATMAGGLFPTAFVPGQGLTPFKVVSEYVIITLLLAALAHLWLRRGELDTRLLWLMTVSIAATVGAEYALTVYTAVGETPTVVGHLLKLLSYWLIYLGVVDLTLTEPFRAMARGATTFDAVPDPTVLLDGHGVIRQTNRAARRFLNMSEDDYVGRHCHALLHDVRVPRERCPVCRAIHAGQPLDGEEMPLPARGLWHQIAISPIRTGAGAVGMVHVGRDITSRVLADRKLRDSEARFRGLVENSNDWVWEVDEAIRYTYVSPQVKAILGYEPEELLGTRPMDLMPPEEAERVGAICAQAIEAHASFKGLENSNRHKDGRMVVLETNGAPYFDEAGNFRGFRGIDRDISERKRIEGELQRHRDELELLVHERTGALEAANKELASFSYSVSHDLRAPLRAIDGFSRMLLKNQGEQLDATGRGLLDRIIAASGRMSRLIDDLLQLARVSKAPLKREEIDLSALAAVILAELRETEPERRVQATIASGLGACGDPVLLRSVLENLLGNAWKFSAGKEPGEIEFGRREEEGEAVYYVRDNGAGFDMQYADKLFGAFQRLHAASEFPGTGIGLATVHRIIQRHGGRVWAESTLGQGTTLFFTLPGEAGAEQDEAAAQAS